ncbi:MAG: hypothetical protein M4579_006057 [Chaenotheca gracillima]|nr:MAG: hypothetical protein M4579_006057 [Chaenotheca gracillima]
MPGFFSKVFKGKEGNSTSPKSKRHAAPNAASDLAPPKPRWEDAWDRKEVEPEEVQVLLRMCTTELKSRALDMPFLLLPFRPASDPSAARSFVRSHFQAGAEGGTSLQEARLLHELRLTEPIVLCSVMKWCWSRLPGGIVTWEAYELFRVGEQDSQYARDSFATFVPISVESDARTKIIFDFFDLLAAIAAHGKNNGLGGRKLSRLGGWWAFDHNDGGEGFDGGYKSWVRAADATSHLFFAYLRSLSPDSVQGINGISSLPISLQTLVQATEYPPETPALMQTTIAKVVMIVDSVSPTPFALLRRAKHFEYRDDDAALQSFADFDDPVETLTEECRRVLKCISSANQSQASDPSNSTSLRNGSWSRFEDIGFSGMQEEPDRNGESELSRRRQRPSGLSTTPHSRRNDHARPTTPSWADFLSSGFADEEGNQGPAPLLLPPDKILPPIETSRARSSQSHKKPEDLEPGELASINRMSLDDSFWWVWITSLAGEEPNERKAVFGRCAVIETNVEGGSWLVMEEKVQGAAPAPDEGAYVVEKKSRFGLTKRARQGKKYPKKDSFAGRPDPYRVTHSVPASKTTIGPDQHARIQAAAAALQERQKQQQQEEENAGMMPTRRGRDGDGYSTKTNSVMTLQPAVMNEAGPAMKWANKFDKDAIREAYLADNKAGRGQDSLVAVANGTANASAPALEHSRNQSDKERELPSLPQERKAVAEPTRNGAPTGPAEVSTPVAPLPPTPAAEPQTPRYIAAEAAEVPLPVEKKAVSPPTATKPASPPSKALPPKPTTSEAAKEPIVEPWTSTPEKKAHGNKLQKRGKVNGFKAVFGRNKKSEAAPTSTLPPAVESPASQKNHPTPQEPTLKRHFSNFRKKNASNSPGASPQPMPATPVSTVDANPTKDSAMDSTTSLTPPSSSSPEQLHHPNEPVEIMPEPSRTAPPPTESEIYRTNTNEERQATAAFSSFDQGPLEDSPAFVPQGDISPSPSPRRRSLSARSSPSPSPLPVANQPGSDEALPTDPEDGAGDLDLTRETSPQDRWAQIRKNAAERAATRASEEQSRPSQGGRTDDGETSGEETIESRVARIKARVAELTGNMEGKQAGKVAAK